MEKGSIGCFDCLFLGVWRNSDIVFRFRCFGFVFLAFLGDIVDVILESDSDFFFFFRDGFYVYLIWNLLREEEFFLIVYFFLRIIDFKRVFVFIVGFGMIDIYVWCRIKYKIYLIFI